MNVSSNIAGGSGRRKIFELVTDGAVHTGSAANTKIFSTLIQANTFSVGQTIMFRIQIRHTGTAGTKTTRAYFNTTDDLSGAQLMGTFPSGATSLSLTMSREFAIKSTTDTEVINATSTIASADGTTTIAVTSNNIDWTIPQYFVVACQLANAADSATFSWGMMTN